MAKPGRRLVGASRQSGQGAKSSMGIIDERSTPTSSLPDINRKNGNDLYNKGAARHRAIYK